MNHTHNDSSHSDESGISIYAKGNIEDDDKDKNNLEKMIALREQHEDEELQYMSSEITGDEGTGPYIDSTIGEAIKKVWQSELSKEKLKRNYEKYKVPFNTLYLKVSIMDSEINHHISKPSNTHDGKLQKHQKNMIKTSTAVVETLNTLFRIKSNEKLSSQTLKELKQKATDSLATLNKANTYNNEMRRDDIFLQLGKNISQISFDILKESKTRFGEDVSKRIVSVKKMKRDIKI